jgi:hypothetical protein
VIVKQAELVVVTPPGKIWIGDMRIDSPADFLPDDEHFKVHHQLVCTACNLGVRRQDDHHCSDPD